MTQPSYQSGLLFTRAHQAVRSRVYELLEQYDLTPPYWSVIGAVQAAPEGIRLSNVAKQMEVKAPMVTMLASELIGKGLLRRVPHHTDRRAKLLVLTPKGKKLALTIEAELNTEIRRLMRGVSATEVTNFQKTLQTIIRNAQV